jgi:hypothetical protein
VGNLSTVLTRLPPERFTFTTALCAVKLDIEGFLFKPSIDKGIRSREITFFMEVNSAKRRPIDKFHFHSSVQIR